MLLSVVLWVLALVVGIVEKNCNSAMSTWMIVYAIFPLILFCYGCCVVFKLALTTEIIMENQDVALGCGIVLFTLVAILFQVQWLIYGCVLFWPEASSNPCRVLVIVSTLMFDQT